MERFLEAIRKRSRKVSGNKMCLCSKGLQSAFRVSFVEEFHKNPGIAFVMKLVSMCSAREIETKIDG